MLTSVRRLSARDRHLAELVRLVPGSFGVKVLGGVAAFGLNVVLARAVGATGTGAFQLALSVTMIASTVARLGFDSAGMRFAAEHAGARPGHLVAIHRRAMRLTLLASAGVTAVLVVCAPLIARHVFSSPSLTGPLRLMALGIVPLTQSTVLVGFLRGIKRAFVASAVESTVIPVISLLGTALLAPRFGVGAAIGVNVLATGTAFAVARRAWARAHVATEAGTVDGRALLSVSLPLFWVASMNLMMQFADVLMVGAFVGQAGAGIYAAALRTATLTNAFLAAMTGVIAPQFAERWAAGDREAVARIARRATVIMTAFSLPFVVVMLAAPGWVMSLFGAEFVPGSSALRLIAAGQLLQTAMGAVGYLLAMTGHHRDLRAIMLASAAAFIGLNLLLIPAFGLVGAGLSYAVSLLGMNVAKSVVAYRRLGIVAVPLPRRRARA